MVKSAAITLDASARAVPLGGAHGFALSAYPGASGQSWPVAVTVRTASGGETNVLAREGVWYALGEPAVSAVAQLPPGAAAASYLLDVGLKADAAAVPAAPVPPRPALEGVGVNDATLLPAVGGVQDWHVLARLARPEGAVGLLVGIHNPMAYEILLALRELTESGERIGGARATGGGLMNANEEADAEPVKAFTPAVLYGAGSATVKWNVAGASIVSAIFSQPSAPPSLLEVLARNSATIAGQDIPAGAVTYSYRFW